MDTLKTIGRPSTDEPIQHLKPHVDPTTLLHRNLLDGPFWQRIPAYRTVDEATFLDHSWQAKNSITNPAKLLAVVQDIVPREVHDDVEQGFRRAPMSIRVSPYLLSLFAWPEP